MNIKDICPQSLRNKWHSIQSSWANMRYGFPASNLKIIGITGTDGKTTTATMIYNILKKAGFKVGLITSVSAKIDKEELDTGFHVTTPDPWDIPRYLRMMVEAGIKWVVLEVTSHGLDQNRVANITFNKAVFTNITNEHLDYHKNWKLLALAKAKLINMVEEGGEIIYKEDERGGKFIGRMIENNSTVLLQTACSDELVKKKNVSREGVNFTYKIKEKEVDIFIPVLGDYNIANAQCAIKTCEDLVKIEDIIEALSEFKGVKGRMQVVRSKRPCLIIVDFAHTPNALKSVLNTVNELRKIDSEGHEGVDKKGKIIVVFGCAGFRDRTKRPIMGKIASKLADVIIITSEDPRTEKLIKINDKILEKIYKVERKLVKRFVNRKDYKKVNLEKVKIKIKERFKKGKKSIFVFDQENINSREDAIDFAVKIAQSNDIVIITGKGHEKSMCFGKTEYPWSDLQAVKRAVKLRYKN